MLADLLAEAAGRVGGSPACVDGPIRLDYAALAARVDSLAASLVAAGVGRGDRVAILEVNSWRYLAAYFAAAHVGAVLVPLNGRLADRELVAILAHSGSCSILVGPSAMARIAALAPTRRSIDLDRVEAAPAPPRARVDADTVAQIYYTSGTTGEPKGVMLTHGNVSAHARAAREALTIRTTEVWGHFAPMFHLADAWAVFAVTLAGGTHVFVPRFDPAVALELIRAESITLTNLVPTMLQRLVEHPAAAGGCPSLRRMLSGGAPISRRVIRAVLDVLGCDYAQTYGMTETCPYLTIGLLPADLAALAPERRLHYQARTGRPMPPVELEVVDEQDRPVPADDRTVGEIRVRGATVSPGYWRNPGATAAAFRGGWLYTGDLAVIDDRGFIDIVDRKKDLILTGGENVYSTEVEHVLAEHPAVLECAVYGVPDPDWGEAVRAAVVMRPGASADAAALVRHCRDRIAGYKVPRTIHFLDELPKTGSGKIYKAGLRTRHAVQEAGPR